MKIKLTEKGKTILFVILAIVILGSGGFLLWRVLQKDSVAPEDSEAGQWSCGEEPLGYQFNRVPSTTDPITEGGTIVLYYKNLLESAHRPQFNFSYEDSTGATKTKSIRIPSLDSNGRSKVVTDIEIPPNGTLTLTGVFDTPPSGAPAWGWELPENGYCGSELLGPPTHGSCTPYEKKNVVSDIGWALNDTQGEIISTQCWADNKEWSGDYDFNDYFLQIGYEPLEEPILPQCWEECTTDPNNCPTGLACQGGKCVNPECPTENDCTCPTVECGDGVLNEGEQCELGNPQGVSCTWTNECMKSTCLCPEVETNPDWDISKTGVKECVEVEEITYAKATYTLTVTNIGEGEGSIDKVVDQLDEKVIEEYLNDVSDAGEYLTNSITWDLEGEEETFQPEDSKIFTYSVQVPEEAYGVYENTVTAHPTEGETFSDTENLNLVCDIEEEEEEPPVVPETGIFDTVTGRLLFGVILILLGINLPSISQLVMKLNYSVKDGVSQRRIKKFERKVAKKK